jgi:2-polyprenyl-6-methoxyphenol hydroxylase-like FAD-dependent oxidoreductase
VLITGAGIAGPTLAYWLVRSGYRPTLLEFAPTLRTGGYMIDFWGPGYTVAERMGLTPQLRQRGYDIREICVTDHAGRTRVRVPTAAMKDALANRFFSIMRGDLARMLFNSVASDVETIFGDSVQALTQHADGVEVQFTRTPRRRFDLVIGADGMHSRIRELMLPGPHEFERELGYRVAAFTARQYPLQDPLAYVTRTIPGRQVARCTLRNGRTTFLMILASELLVKQSLGTISKRKQALASTLMGIGQEEGQIRSALEDCDDLYFDVVKQIQLPTWSEGRVALIGDAAYCPSLLAGQGASLAMVGAYILAGELATAPDHVAAFMAYERRLKPFVERVQRSAVRLGGWFAPRTRAGLWVRNELTRAAAIPAVSRLLARRMSGSELALPHQAPRGLLVQLGRHPARSRASGA